jgi:hypothetical protein
VYPLTEPVYRFALKELYILTDIYRIATECVFLQIECHLYAVWSRKRQGYRGRYLLGGSVMKDNTVLDIFEIFEMRQIKSNTVTPVKERGGFLEITGLHNRAGINRMHLETERLETDIDHQFIIGYAQMICALDGSR